VPTRATSTSRQRGASAMRAGPARSSAAVRRDRHRGRHVGDEAVGETVVEQRSTERGAAFTRAWSTPRPARTSSVAASRRPHRWPRRDGEHLRARREPAALRGIGGCSVGDDEGGREVGVEQRTGRGHASGGVEQHPQRLGVHRTVGVAHVRRGRSANAVPAPITMACESARRRGRRRATRPGDPLRRSVARGDAPVEAHGRLHDGEGAAGRRWRR